MTHALCTVKRDFGIGGRQLHVKCEVPNQKCSEAIRICNNWGENYWSVNVNMRNWSRSKVSEFTVCFRSMKNQSKFGWTYWSVISSGWCVGNDDQFFLFLENWLETFIKNEPKGQIPKKKKKSAGKKTTTSPYTKSSY